MITKVLVEFAFVNLKRNAVNKTQSNSMNLRKICVSQKVASERKRTNKPFTIYNVVKVCATKFRTNECAHEFKQSTISVNCDACNVTDMVRNKITVLNEV
jgi:hypothetical protein